MCKVSLEDLKRVLDGNSLSITHPNVKNYNGDPIEIKIFKKDAKNSGITVLDTKTDYHNYHYIDETNLEMIQNGVNRYLESQSLSELDYVRRLNKSRVKEGDVVDIIDIIDKSPERGKIAYFKDILNNEDGVVRYYVLKQNGTPGKKIKLMNNSKQVLDR